MGQALTVESFSQILKREFPVSFEGQALAVGVSGGPDSMALLRLLCDWGKAAEIHAIIVDHGLRAESADEARGVYDQIKDWPGVCPVVLRWEDGVQSRIQEEARKARYGLMAEYCVAHEISCLFLAHHMDDQAETFLFRLAKGSGVDGLAAMKPMQIYNEQLTLVRPLLGVAKDGLVAFCESVGVSYVLDPSNQSDRFARVRLRKSAEVLAEEGLSAKRLSVTARRLARAQEALEKIAGEAFENVSRGTDTDSIVLDSKAWLELTNEIAIRIVLESIRRLKPNEDYLPRMERIEDLFYDLKNMSVPFRKRTLGGLVFERKDREDLIIISLEEREKSY